VTANAHIWAPNSAMSRRLVRGQRIAIAVGAETVAATVADIGSRSFRRTWGTITAAASAVKPAARSAAFAPGRGSLEGFFRGMLNDSVGDRKAAVPEARRRLSGSSD
jgi:hypothetical protein